MAKGLPRSLAHAKTPIPAAAIPAATETNLGGVLMMPSQAPAAAADVAALKAQFDALLGLLVDAGLMAAE